MVGTPAPLVRLKRLPKVGDEMDVPLELLYEYGGELIEAGSQRKGVLDHTGKRIIVRNPGLEQELRAKLLDQARQRGDGFRNALQRFVLHACRHSLRRELRLNLRPLVAVGSIARRGMRARADLLLLHVEDRHEFALDRAILVRTEDLRVDKVLGVLLAQ